MSVAVLPDAGEQPRLQIRPADLKIEVVTSLQIKLVTSPSDRRSHVPFG